MTKSMTTPAVLARGRMSRGKKIFDTRAALVSREVVVRVTVWLKAFQLTIPA